MTRTSGQDGIYYGWWVLGTGAVAEILSIGSTSYSAGFFVLPLQKEFGLSRASASLPVLILYLGAVCFAPFAGRLMDRYPIRWIASLGALLFATSFALIAAISSPPLMALLLLLPAAAGFALFGPIMPPTLAARWFYRNRGLAQGIAAIAASGGGLIVAPLVSKTIAAYGWRIALAGEAAILFVLVAGLSLLILKDNPIRAGLGENKENQGRPDAALLAVHAGQGGAPSFRGWREILGHAGFWGPSLLLATASGVGEAIVVAVPPYGQQLGIATALLASLIALFAAATALSKIVAGVLADRLDKRILMFCSALGMPLSFIMLSWFSGYSALMAASCFAGAATGGILPVATALLQTRFGAARFGAIMGCTYALMGTAAILAVEFSATLFDLTGGYHQAFVWLLAICVVLIPISALIDRRTAQSMA
jgi:MFS family permease